MLDGYIYTGICFKFDKDVSVLSIHMLKCLLRASCRDVESQVPNTLNGRECTFGSSSSQSSASASLSLGRVEART